MLLLRSAFAFTLWIGAAYACNCREPRVQFKRDHADVIFRGTIIELRDSERPAGFGPGAVPELKKIVVFRVSRAWKGDIGPIFEMPAVTETSMCIGFWPDYLRVGTDLLIYAHRENSEYYTGICGSHKLAKDAVHKDFKVLGPGKLPLLSKAQDSK